jgi:hypothetical protein
MKVNLDPTRGGCDILSVILCTPTLHKAHPDRTHFGQLVHCLESMVDRLSKKSGKLLVIENLEAAAGRNLTHRGGMESMVVVTVSRLHEYSRITDRMSHPPLDGSRFTFMGLFSGWIRCSHRWEVLAIIFLQSPKKL